MSDEIIIYKKKRGGSGDHGHHGGSWKIAFADFMTAMMALFLLLWLVSITTQEQKEGIATFFNPMAFDETRSASDGMLAGKEVDVEGVDNSKFPTEEQLSPTAEVPVYEDVQSDPGVVKENSDDMSSEALEMSDVSKSEIEFGELREEILEKMSVAVDLEMLAENVIIDITPEGLRIQITDRDQMPMFPVGSTGMTAGASSILSVIGEAVSDVSNRVAITGHTDGLPYRDNAGFDNWDLSSGRANTARRILVQSGIGADRINRVEGLADRDHLVEDDPNDPRNRRISVMLLRNS